MLPLGSLNHFSKDAGIPQDVEQAVSTVFAGRVTAVDVGEVNARIFLNNSSLGTYPEVVRMREEEQRQGQGNGRRSRTPGFPPCATTLSCVSGCGNVGRKR